MFVNGINENSAAFIKMRFLLSQLPLSNKKQYAEKDANVSIKDWHK